MSSGIAAGKERGEKKKEKSTVASKRGWRWPLLSFTKYLLSGPSPPESRTQGKERNRRKRKK